MKNSHFYFAGILFLFIHFSAFSQHIECGTPDYNTTNIQQYLQTLEKVNQSPDMTGKLPITNIPVQIHLFQTSGGTATITLTQIRAEIASVNTFYANANLKLVECIAPEIIQDDNLYNYNVSQESYVLANHYTNNLINLYFPNKINVTTSQTVCGYAMMPPNPDFVFIAASCATNHSTFAHELGHYFGLPHTHSKWQNLPEFVNGTNCSTAGDLICDTPADPDLTNRVNSSNCAYTGTVLDPNNQPYNPDTRNMMSYAPVSCRNKFSNTQYSIIYNTYLNYRSYLSCGPTSVNDQNVLNNIRIYPNPANHSFSIGLLEKDIINLSIYSVEGKEVMKENNIQGNQLIDVSTIDKGVYIVRIKLNECITSKPLVIVN